MHLVLRLPHRLDVASRRVGRLAFALPIIAILLAACSHSNSELIESAPLISRRFKDDYGRSVTLNRVPKRVVSLAANITEMVYAIKAQDRLSGVSHDSDFPQDASGKPFVITYPDFDLPGVVALEPDFILASTEIHDQRITDFFERYRFPLYFQDYKNLEDIFTSIRELGQMLGAESPANHLADSLTAATKAITDSTAGQIKYKTVLVLGIDPITVVGGGSFMNDLITKAGAQNPFSVLPEKYPTVTPEQFIMAAPEYVILPTHNDRAWVELVAQFPDIQTKIPATELNHVFQVEPDVIVRPGPRIVEGLAYITRILHPRVSVD